MVAAEGEDFGFGEGGVGEGGRARVEGCEGCGELAQGEGVVEGGEGDVAAVEKGERRGVGVEAAAGVEAAEGELARGGGADRAGAEAGACVGGESVSWGVSGRESGGFAVGVRYG